MRFACTVFVLVYTSCKLVPHYALDYDVDRDRHPLVMSKLDAMRLSEDPESSATFDAETTVLVCA